MSTHQDVCPKYVNDPNLPIKVWRSEIPCWVCSMQMRKKYADYVPMLPSLYAWLENGEDFTSDEWCDLHYYFSNESSFGELCGDAMLDEWLCDRPDRIEELIANIEHYCIQEVA